MMLSLRICVLVAVVILQQVTPSVLGFATLPSTQQPSSSALFATKKKKKKGGKKQAGPSFGGFGGGAMETCPCGSGETYSNCCSQIHKNVQNFRKASAQDIVKARYSAYAKKNPEFLMMSTHPNNKAFNPDLRAWKENIKVNMYDKFDLENCIIVEETYDEVAEDAETETATVQFIAEMVLKETGEMTAFMETSKFEKAKNSGAWLYLSGEIEEVPSDEDGDEQQAGDDDDDKSVEEKLAEQL
mmetsp:Transcript_18071/g.44957  ORF Transcript_18071/g.44957 Transcript_18071/m.44957 type:complete len:243 (+) Transcript_18071:150-878(+)